VREHLNDDLSLEALARVAGFSPFHFHRLFKSLTEETINEMVRSGEIVGFRAAIQYADGSTGISSGGFCRQHPIIGALNNLIYKENSAPQD